MDILKFRNDERGGFWVSFSGRIHPLSNRFSDSNLLCLFLGLSVALRYGFFYYICRNLKNIEL
jgi:hypothetical protein